jgi:cytochrome c oxidase subunit 3
MEDGGAASAATIHPPSSTHHSPHLAHHFDDVEQQRESTTLGMWAFLVTEVMFFGALFAAYITYNASYGPAFAEAARHLNVPLATLNTGVLLTSSLAMALGVRAAQTGARRATVAYLLLTIVMGAAFLAIKGYEYYSEYQEGLVPLNGFRFTYEGADPRQAQLFFNFYFAMTGLHALHMIIGICVMAVLAFFAWRGRFSPEYYTPVELTGLYWHFVDVVWVFLFPLLYLLHRHSG